MPVRSNPPGVAKNEGGDLYEADDYVDGGALYEAHDPVGCGGVGDGGDNVGHGGAGVRRWRLLERLRAARGRTGRERSRSRGQSLCRETAPLEHP